MHFAEHIPTRTADTRLAAGLAVSLLAHALLLLAYRGDRPARDFSLESRDEPLSVWVHVPPPAATRPQPVEAAPTTPAARRPRPSPRIIAVDPAPAAQPGPAITVVEPAETAQRFDMDAARAAARGMANEPELSAQGRVKERPIAAETKLARDIARSERRDCKDGIPGGLLAPLYLLMDKKDHGCKW